MKPREEVVKFIECQLYGDYLLPKELPKPHTHHYGCQELRALLDYLYDGPPQSARERLYATEKKRAAVEIRPRHYEPQDSEGGEI